MLPVHSAQASMEVPTTVRSRGQAGAPEISTAHHSLRSASAIGVIEGDSFTGREHLCVVLDLVGVWFAALFEQTHQLQARKPDRAQVDAYVSIGEEAACMSNLIRLLASLAVFAAFSASAADQHWIRVSSDRFAVL